MDPFGPGCNVTKIAVGANQTIDGVNSQGRLVGAILVPAAAACDLQIFSNNGASGLMELSAPASGASVPCMMGEWAPTYNTSGGAQPALSATLTGAGAAAYIYWKPLKQ